MKDNQYIKSAQQKLIDYCSNITRIYLISVKVDTMGELKSFKLGLIVDNSVKSTSELAGHLYFYVDSELPYDLVIYKEEEFESLKNEIGTFAWKIYNSGTVLYG